MSQDPNKFDPKEATEAKLCAYVDGDLDAAGRAEIEKYLQTNPQHRKLLEELKQTRDLMRALPRASAPPDVGEMLHGQLERSLLLNDLDVEPAEQNMRISRAAQFRAVAAVIVLALTLGAIVYFALPSSKQRVTLVGPPPVNTGSEHESSTASSTQITPVYEEPTAVAPTPSAAPSAPGALAERMTEPAPRAMGKALAGKTAGGFTMKQSKDKTALAGDMDPFRNRMQAKVQNVLPAENTANYMCVVVSTTDPASTRQRLHSYLANNKIQWQTVTEPMPQPINFAPSQVVMTSRLNQTTVRLRSNEQSLQQTAVAVTNAAAASPGADALDMTQPTTRRYLAKGGAMVEPATQVQELESAPVPTPAISLLNSPLQKLTFGLVAPVQRSAPLDHYIIARNMTPAQTNELTDLLSREAGAGTVQVFDGSSRQEPAQLQILSDTLQSQQSQQVQVVQQQESQQAQQSAPPPEGNATIDLGAAQREALATQPSVEIAPIAQQPAAPTTAPIADRDLSLHATAQPQTQDVVIVLRKEPPSVIGGSVVPAQNSAVATPPSTQPDVSGASTQPAAVTQPSH